MLSEIAAAPFCGAELLRKLHGSLCALTPGKEAKEAVLCNEASGLRSAMG